MDRRKVERSLNEVKRQAALIRTRSGYAVLRDPTSATLSWNEQLGLTNSYEGLSDEQRALLVVDLRRFIQKREAVSFQSLRKVFDSEWFLQERRERFQRSEQAFWDVWGGETAITSDGEKLTYRRLFDIYTNGVVAHRDDDKASLADAWVDGLAYAIYLAELDRAFRILIDGVEWLDSFCGFASEEMREAA